VGARRQAAGLNIKFDPRSHGAEIDRWSDQSRNRLARSSTMNDRVTACEQTALRQDRPLMGKYCLSGPLIIVLIGRFRLEPTGSAYRTWLTM